MVKYPTIGRDPRPKSVDVLMTTQTIARSDIRRALLWGAMLAVLWTAVAILRPATTFHLAPFLVAGAPPVLLVLDEGASAGRVSVLRVGMISAALAIGTALVLLAIGATTGPAFEVFPSPLVEAVAFAGVGAVGGIGFGWWRTR
jgi:hypothetical protein